jgi:hypothetical protein
MATTSPYTIFNNVVSDMLSDLTARFSGSKELSACQMYHKMACKANIKLPYEKFVELAVVPYGDRLVSHDDSFFVEKQYNVADEEGCGIVDALKKLWKHMTAEDRQRVHDYLDLLLGVHAGLARA